MRDLESMYMGAEGWKKGGWWDGVGKGMVICGRRS